MITSTRWGLPLLSVTAGLLGGVLVAAFDLGMTGPSAILGGLAGGMAAAVLIMAGVGRRHRAAPVVERASAEEQLERLRRESELILSSAGEGILGLDPAGNTTFVNPAASRLLRYEPAELIGTHQHQRIHHSRPDGSSYGAEECLIDQTLSDGSVRTIEDEVFWRKDGTSFPVEYTVTPMREGTVIAGAVVVFRDISERLAIDRMKDEFVSVVSHELRTPLTSIRGALGLIASGMLGEVPDKGQRMLDIAISNTDRLVRLINDILDIERMESGAVKMEREPCNAAELMSQAVETMRAMADEAGVSLHATPVWAQLNADPDRILQTVTNLLSNGVKFSDWGGRVWLSAERTDSELIVRVRDEGRGIPAEKLESIFERFLQVDASDSRAKGGTGLGLSICRSIVEQHGGTIWAESRIDFGSSFYFTLPIVGARPTNGSPTDLDPPSRPGELDEPQVDPRKPLVLLCDDDPTMLDVLTAILEANDYATVTTTSGAHALEKTVSERPDVILMDLIMPDGSGWDAVASLKENELTRSVPIVLLSVVPPHGSPERGELVSGWLQKPVDESTLLGAIEDAISSAPQAPRVLIIEDDEDLASLLIGIFDRRGWSAYHARTGRDAVRLSQITVPDLLVLDLGLPEGNGFAVVDWMRQHDKLHTAPMVVYTARDLTEEEESKLTLGETLFLVKSRTTMERFEEKVADLILRIAPVTVEVPGP